MGMQEVSRGDSAPTTMGCRPVAEILWSLGTQIQQQQMEAFEVRNKTSKNYLYEPSIVV